MIKSLFGIVADVTRIVTAPIEIAADVTRAATKPVAKAADAAVKEVKKNVKP